MYGWTGKILRVDLSQEKVVKEKLDAELKKSGFDLIIFQGCAPEPMYLWIENGQAELRLAGHRGM